MQVVTWSSLLGGKGLARPGLDSFSQRVLLYLQETLSLGASQELTIKKRDETSCCQLSDNEISKARVRAEAAKALWRQEPSKVDQFLDVVLVCSTGIRSKCRERGLQALAMFSAKLGYDGQLIVEPKALPWISKAFIASTQQEDNNRSPFVLAEYEKVRYKLKVAARGSELSVSELVDMADELVRRTAEQSGAANILVSDAFDLVSRYLVAASFIDLTGRHIELLKAAYEAETGDDKAALIRYVTEGAYKDRVTNPCLSDIDSRFSAAKLNLASVDGKYPLAPSQRLAVNAFLTSRETDARVMALSGPPGTGKTTTMQTMVANVVAGGAFRMLDEKMNDLKSAPLIGIVSTNNQAVTNALDSFEKMVNDDDPLAHRWLPFQGSEASETGPHDARRMIPGLGLYLPAGHVYEEAVRAGWPVSRYIWDTFEDYSNPGYLKCAEAALLNEARGYFGSMPGGLVSLSKGLARRLLDMRSLILGQISLIEDDYEREASNVAERFATEMGLASLLDRLDVANRQTVRCENAATRWRRVKMRRHGSPFRRIRSLFISERTEICARTSQEDDALDGFVSLEEVIRHYEMETDRYHEETARLAHRVDELKTLAEAKASSYLADNYIRRLDALERELDKGLRREVFWLSVHLFECAWVRGLSGFEYGRKSPDPWLARQMLACVFPVQVMTCSKMPFALKRTRRGVEYDYGCFDELFFDEAGQIDPSLGLSCLPFAKHAVAIGDALQIPPVRGLDRALDETVARGAGLVGPDFFKLLQSGLSCSDGDNGAPGGSLVAAASQSTTWLSEDGRPRAPQLVEHYRCYDEIIGVCNELWYKGRLEPMRGSAYEEPGRPSAPLPPVCFCPVNYSRDVSDNGSRKNEEEAQAIALWLVKYGERFTKAYSKSSGFECGMQDVFAVVTPFKAQAKLVSQELSKLAENMMGSNDWVKKMTIGTAHKLQGAERPIVIFSLTYEGKSEAAFVERYSSLLNVAISRAKDSFVVFGNPTWMSCPKGKVMSRLARFYERMPDLEDFSPERDITEVQRIGAADAARSESVAPKLGPGPRRVSISQLLKSLKERHGSGLLPSSASSANEILSEAGLIERTKYGYVPTAKGRLLGMEIGRGKDVNKGISYEYPVYDVSRIEDIYELLVRRG